ACECNLAEGDQVLDLEERVAGPLEPPVRELSEPLRVVEVSPEVLDQREEESRERFLAATAELGRERRAACKLLLRRREVADVVEQGPHTQVPADTQRPIVDLLRDADRVPPILERFVIQHVIALHLHKYVTCLD